ncbi:MAG: hypothetical protein IT440_03925 [Phycisphaeraceae bacterium]|nr:hypothetical protein [Phycisphaeraceae bacterium]
MADKTTTRPDPTARKGGRGWRPWLLLPKVLAVAVYFGSLAATATAWIGRASALPSQADLCLAHLLLTRLVIPALTITLLLGALLTLQHPRVLAAQRWWQAKAAILFILVPGAHLFMASRMMLLRQAMASPGQPELAMGLARQMEMGFVLILAASAVVMFLGRHKPRFGQNWARTFAKIGSREALLLAIGAVLAGCQSSPDVSQVQEDGRRVASSDFALEFFVHGPTHAATRRSLRAKYVLLPNRRLHVALADEAMPHRFPGHYRLLSSNEVDDLAQLVDRSSLIAEPTSPRAEEAGVAGSDQATDKAILYEVTVTSAGRTNRYRTTPEESPPTAKLLDRLILLTGGRLPANPARNTP